MLLLIAPGLAPAQQSSTDPGTADQVERTRIQEARARLESGYAAQEAACYSRFALTDCLVEARSRRIAGTRVEVEDLIVAIINATPVVRGGYRLGVPQSGFYCEIMNTDAAHYGGSNVGNMGGQQAADQPAQGRPYSLVLTLPPLAAIFLKWQPS